ncbi:MAG TPA: tyrosine-type recombinase/integrase [Nitrososphaeraceae archaeon]|nr:tyrosine-type recombinase/integrase [Nitrososphaeraceae archaeon]
MSKDIFLVKRADEQQKVKVFLENVARNSPKSKSTYNVALTHFDKFLSIRNYTLESIIEALSKNHLDVYVLLESFVSHLLSLKSKETKLTPSSIALYLAAIRSYMAYYDIDIVPAKFKRKVRLPKVYREDEEALDVQDIRKILLSCHNRRLKAYLLVLASGGMRASEALAIRLKDIDFSVNPTKIHIRKEFAKTRVARDIYISDEAIYHLKQWIDWKYRKRDSKARTPIQSPEDLVFTMKKVPVTPHGLYVKMEQEFNKILAIIGFDERKEEGVYKRRKITLHSFRRFCKSIISNQVNKDYSEWFLGHASKSPYYTIKEVEKREIYGTRCMKYLTFLDYSTLEATGKNIEAKLSEKEKEIQLLRQRDSVNTDAIANLSDQVMKLMTEVEEMKKQSRLQ